VINNNNNNSNGRKHKYYKGNTEVLIVASKQIELEGNADETKCMLLSRSECRTKSQYED
jgi:hypothetical protein